MVIKNRRPRPFFYFYTMPKPELLLPAGSPEAFHAALEGGADAVYLGFSRFNARQRAKNFNLPQLAGLLDIAAKKNVRVYITLNTLIKNGELGELLDQLHLIASSGAAAAIIQELGRLAAPRGATSRSWCCTRAPSSASTTPPAPRISRAWASPARCWPAS
jgi:hypothetical protein